MGSPFTRPQLVGDINKAFNAKNIDNTADSVAHLAEEADAFDIAERYGRDTFLAIRLLGERTPETRVESLATTAIVKVSAQMYRSPLIGMAK